jgi:hypothetical protein
MPARTVGEVDQVAVRIGNIVKQAASPLPFRTINSTPAVPASARRTPPPPGSAGQAMVHQHPAQGAETGAQAVNAVPGSYAVAPHGAPGPTMPRCRCAGSTGPSHNTVQHILQHRGGIQRAKA